MPRGPRSTMDAAVCKTHAPKIVNFYCKAHDEPACEDCKTLKHKSCKIERVQDISDGFQETKEFNDINQKLKQLHRELYDVECVLNNNARNLDYTTDSILCTIASVRKEINNYLSQIQTKLTDEAVQMKKKDDEELKSLQEKHQAMKFEIEAMFQTMHDSNANLNSLFVVTKQAKQRLVTMEKEIKTIGDSEQQQYEFIISDKMKKILSTKPPLGKVRRHSKKSCTTRKHIEMTPRTPTMYTKSSYNRSINVKCDTDKTSCCITDCTLLSIDSLVVIDRDNNNVKLIDMNGNKVVSSYSTPSEPNNVTTISSKMIAVTLPSDCKIQLLNVTTIFTLQHDINVHKACSSIAYKDERLAVGYMNPSRVDILDIQGTILHTIQPKQEEEYVLQELYDITFGQEKDTVIVSDAGTDTVSVVTFSGHILRTYTHHTLKDPQGIVITIDGVLFVRSLRNGCIHVVSPDFKSSKIIIKKDDNVVQSSRIAYCHISHRLYISNENNLDRDAINNIYVYNLHD